MALLAPCQSDQTIGDYELSKQCSYRRFNDGVVPTVVQQLPSQTLVEAGDTELCSHIGSYPGHGLQIAATITSVNAVVVPEVLQTQLKCQTLICLR